MNLNYKLTHNDFLEYQLYASSKSKTQKRNRKIRQILTPVFILVYGLLSPKNDENYITISVIALIAILYFVLYPLYSKWAYKRHFEKHINENYKNRINTPVEITFNENFINAKDFASESNINGNEIQKLVETKNHFFIKLTNDSSLVIPKHCIENIDEFKKIVTGFGATYVDELNWKWK